MGYKGTIILACYNKEDYLNRSLDSIVALSRFQDFEVIIVDDKSKDNSVSIIKEYTKKYNNMKLIEFEKGSGGPSKPRNVGIKASSTPYLIFMDPDDEIINDGYSLLLTKMEELESDILIAAREGINERKRREWIDYIDLHPYVNENNDRIKKDLLTRRPFILKTIYSKNLIEENNISFCEDITTSEDEVFDMRCVANAHRITKINDIVYRYSVGAEGSITTDVSIKIYEQMPKVICELEKSYKLMFEEEVVINRIVGLINAFYLPKLAFLKDYNDIKYACNYIYEACEMFGFDRLEKAGTKDFLMIVSSIKEKDYLYITSRYLKGQLNKSNNEIKKLNKQIIKYDNLKNRKVTKLAQKLTRIRKGKSKKEIKKEHSLHKIEELNNISSTSNGYWVFQDRIDKGQDNAEALYEYVMTEGIHEKIAFIISKSCPDFQRLKNKGFNIIEHNTMEHWTTLRDADYYFTSHCDDRMLYPWLGDLKKKNKYLVGMEVKYKLVFLQHGVIRSDMSSWLGQKKYFKFVSSSNFEAKSLLDLPNYRLSKNEVILSGLARHDKLVRRDLEQNMIIVFPTWRKEFVFADDTKDKDFMFRNSSFYLNWSKFFKSEYTKRIMNNEKTTIKFVLHNDNIQFKKIFEEFLPSNVELISYEDIESFSDLVNDSSMLITDYSSFSFDFLYLEKPVLYFDFEKNAITNNIPNMEYSRYGYYHNDVESAVLSLDKIVRANFKIADELRQNINDMFAHRDNKNCQRIIEQTIKMGLEND